MHIWGLSSEQRHLVRNCKEMNHSGGKQMWELLRSPQMNEGERVKEMEKEDEEMNL